MISSSEFIHEFLPDLVDTGSRLVKDPHMRPCGWAIGYSQLADSVSEPRISSYEWQRLKRNKPILWLECILELELVVLYGDFVVHFRNRVDDPHRGWIFKPIFLLLSSVSQIGIRFNYFTQ